MGLLPPPPSVMGLSPPPPPPSVVDLLPPTVDQVLFIAQMRNKAMELLTSEKEEDAVCESVPSNYNELIISIQGCKGLKRSPSHCPSPYVVYKFHTFPDSDTPIVPNTQDPVFDDTQHFPVAIDCSLDCYLRTEVRGLSP